MEVTDNPKADHTPAKLDEDAVILLNAANIIERSGHFKGWMYKECPVTGPACLLGAILRAVSGSSEGWSGTHPQHKLIVRLGRKVHPELADWNDQEERTASEVVARIRAAALGG